MRRPSGVPQSSALATDVAQPGGHPRHRPPPSRSCLARRPGRTTSMRHRQTRDGTACWIRCGPRSATRSGWRTMRCHSRRTSTELAIAYGRYGYRRITALLRAEGWRVNHKRVERIWRQEGLKVPKRQPKRSRLWLNDGSCVRRRAEYRDQVWSYDFVLDRRRTTCWISWRTCSCVEERRPGRAAEPGDLLHTAGGAGADRGVARRVQSAPTAQRPGLPATGTQGSPDDRGTNIGSGTTTEGRSAKPTQRAQRRSTPRQEPNGVHRVTAAPLSPMSVPLPSRSTRPTGS